MRILKDVLPLSAALMIAGLAASGQSRQPSQTSSRSMGTHVAGANHARSSSRAAGGFGSPGGAATGLPATATPSDQLPAPTSPAGITLSRMPGFVPPPLATNVRHAPIATVHSFSGLRGSSFSSGYSAGMIHSGRSVLGSRLAHYFPGGNVPGRYLSAARFAGQKRAEAAGMGALMHRSGAHLGVGASGLGKAVLASRSHGGGRRLHGGGGNAFGGSAGAGGFSTSHSGF